MSAKVGAAASASQSTAQSAAGRVAPTGRQVVPNSRVGSRAPVSHRRLSDVRHRDPFLVRRRLGDVAVVPVPPLVGRANDRVSDEEWRHNRLVAKLTAQRHRFLSGLDLPSRYDTWQHWRSRPGQMIFPQDYEWAGDAVDLRQFGPLFEEQAGQPTWPDLEAGPSARC